ncbi:hypothetical protein [Pseudomonas sp. SDO5591_S426]
MSAKIFCLPLAISMQLLSAEAFSAVYCGVVNGVQVWDELVPSNCTKALRQMQLSNEHIQSSQKGQRIEKSYGAPSSKAVENAVTSFGDYMQQRSDEKDEQERRQKSLSDADDEQRRQAKLQSLRGEIILPTPHEEVKKIRCGGSPQNFASLAAPPEFVDPKLKDAVDTLSRGMTFSELDGLSKLKKGKANAIEFLQNTSNQFDHDAVNSFERMASNPGYSAEIVVEMANGGRANDLGCDISNNLELCKYMLTRWAGLAMRTAAAIGQKCLK